MKKISTSCMFTALMLLTLSAFSVPKLNSYPSAQAVIFIDFDGHYVNNTFWNGGTPFYCTPSGLTDAQITEAFNRAAEDYRPFNINLTTDSTVFLAAPINKRMRVIVTATSNWYLEGYGGVAYLDSFTWGDDTPCFVFSDRHGYSPKRVGETISHESGHTVGLSHQSKYGGDCDTPEEPYNLGYGTGETAWAPIMGNSLSRNFSNWNNGPTPWGCTDVQDNLTIITTQNGFTYRTDDYTGTVDATATALTGNFTKEGVISTNTDKDAFKFTLPGNRNFRLTAIPGNVSSNWIGANLDIRIELYNASETLIRDYNPLGTLSVTIDTILNAGTYYLRVYGTGNNNIGAYGSLGSYTLSGSLGGGLPIHDVTLSGTADKGKHDLNWRIIADEPVKTIEVQTSNDGINFSNLTTITTASATKFAYQPYKNSTIFYRLKVTSVINETAYSNTIALKGAGAADKLFSVSTLVQNEIIINAAANYQYVITDINGRRVYSGTGLKGINRVNVANQADGMYIIQLFNDDQRQTERIIKQ